LNLMPSFPRRLNCGVGIALSALLLLGTLVAGAHHHAGAHEDAGCAVCTLAHTAAATAPVVAVPAPSFAVVEWVRSPDFAPPECAARHAAQPRAPPES
jgi:hypothetical protein